MTIHDQIGRNFLMTHFTKIDINMNPSNSLYEKKLSINIEILLYYYNIGVVKRNPLFLHEIEWKNNGFLFTIPNIKYHM